MGIPFYPYMPDPDDYDWGSDSDDIEKHDIGCTCLMCIPGN